MLMFLFQPMPIRCNWNLSHRQHTRLKHTIFNGRIRNVYDSISISSWISRMECLKMDHDDLIIQHLHFGNWVALTGANHWSLNFGIKLVANFPNDGNSNGITFRGKCVKMHEMHKHCWPFQQCQSLCPFVDANQKRTILFIIFVVWCFKIRCMFHSNQVSWPKFSMHHIHHHAQSWSGWLIN